MGTRSTIAVCHQDGTISQIYCHWDGYLRHNGSILQSYYDSLAAAEKLISGGNLSSLNKYCSLPLGQGHNFNNPQPGHCVYYGRDRGEANQQPKLFADINAFIYHAQWQEYNYIFINDHWMVDRRPGYEDTDAPIEFYSLKDVLIANGISLQSATDEII